MQSKRGELVPIGEVIADLDGPAPALRDGSPPARHSFTVADQVEQLVTASEADPERGFMARTMALCSLPRTNPGNRKEYIRRNGPYTLAMTAGVNNKLPYGNFPRLILAWVCSEAVRTQSRELVLGRSLADFMRTLGVYDSGGENASTPSLRNQMKRLFGCSVSLIYEDAQREATVNRRDRRPHRVLVESEAQARQANAVGEQDRTQRETFSTRSSATRCRST